ncbi:hypothetical protein C8R43DRAFT_1010832 [Mycena crocata]|nr:hypothetical protein C8R43DRAFT_1010775 [Mycena crocata]KAJ7147438.1 hypothetical protein C8R43DRAFT_1010792 [Mycena crocata]KAJ7147442.1 hypothetical protein C8R43DRAFT_1010819 [Mycena crocata]KAJ7147445.1 hypothetical protein C8R43DRAFT_1010832 [Mycena crocata]
MLGNLASFTLLNFALFIGTMLASCSLHCIYTCMHGSSHFGAGCMLEVPLHVGGISGFCFQSFLSFWSISSGFVWLSSIGLGTVCFGFCPLY